MGEKATAWCRQVARSREEACPHAIDSCQGPAGLCWKKTCHTSPILVMPLGSLSQPPAAGRRWYVE